MFLRIWLFGVLTLCGVLAIAADEDDEEIPEEGWYCIPDPADGGWACGIGEEPPITVPQPPPGVHPREDYSPEIRPLQDPGAPVTLAIPTEPVDPRLAAETEPPDPGEPPPDSRSDDTLFRSTPLTPAGEPAAQAPESSAPAQEPSAPPAVQPSTGDFVIQLVGARDPANVEAFIERHQLAGQVTSRRTWLHSNAWYVVLMGPYPDFETANRALENLPEGLRNAGPFIRRQSQIE